MIRVLPIALMFGLAAPALADPLRATVTPGNTSTEPPSEWMGTVPHFVLMGTASGYRFDVQYPDMEDAGGITGFSASPNDAGGDAGSAGFDLTLTALIAGVEKTIGLEIALADLPKAAGPLTLPLAPAPGGDGPSATVTLTLKWEVDGASVDETLTGWTGSFTLARDGDASDPMGATFAGFLDAHRGEDHLAASFSAPVTGSAAGN